MEQLTNERRLALGLQHMVAMFGATILVPLITGLNPSVALISAGIGTLIFHLVTKRMVPVFLGSSFAFIPPILAAAGGGATFGEIGIGIFCAGLVYLAMSGLVMLIGPGFVRKIFPPLVTGPVIVVIGVTLAPIAIGQAEGVWIIAIVTLLATIVAAIWFKGLFKMLPILTGFIVGFFFAWFWSLVTDFSMPFDALRSADWIAWPSFVTGDLGFDWNVIVLIAPIAFVTMIEHVGDILANGRVVGKDFFKEPGVHRTLMGDGLATSVAGLLGGPPNTTYSENTGVLAVTQVYDPVVLRIAAVFAIALGFIPKFGGLLLTVPVPVLGGLSVVLFGMIAAVGLRTLVEGRVDFKKTRNMIIAGLILVFGLGVSGLSTPLAITFGDTSIQISGLALGAVVGVIANLIIPGAEKVED
ncbi:MAG: uracil-xanthine permease family protein [Actinobacteria bacterium]|jgi:uracil permease|nr:uracil-xanthine permease family protein [Actinomycetota bacterium]MBU1494188.1 uracil-xanthine permease family protein [Actinomycetota bacterium]MBU1865643.1 uracil-xanthine permease family protein [Actinomycetota bacterium]